MDNSFNWFLYHCRPEKFFTEEWKTGFSKPIIVENYFEIYKNLSLFFDISSSMNYLQFFENDKFEKSTFFISKFISNFFDPF